MRVGNRMCMSRRKEFWRLSVIWWATVLHTIWGVLIMLSADALGATPVALIDLLIPGPRWLLGIVYLIVAALSVGGLWSQPGKLRQLMFLPQQVFLLTAAIGSGSAVARGMYLDGTVRPPIFILSDQLPIMMLAAAYVVAVLNENGVHKRHGGCGHAPATEPPSPSD